MKERAPIREMVLRRSPVRVILENWNGTPVRRVSIVGSMNNQPIQPSGERPRETNGLET